LYIVVAVFVACCVCVLDIAPHDRRQNGGETTATAAAAADDDEMLADRLLAKLDREHNTNCDVQIGDGMDIGIMGENGRNHMLLIRLVRCRVPNFKHKNYFTEDESRRI
jgi:hypothetical protein